MKLLNIFSFIYYIIIKFYVIGNYFVFWFEIVIKYLVCYLGIICCFIFDWVYNIFYYLKFFGVGDWILIILSDIII